MRNPIDGVELTEPKPLRLTDLLRVHCPDYVRAVQTGTPTTLSESQGFMWDAGLWDMELAVNGGVLESARSALTDGVSGSMSSGLHHAAYGRGHGYCTFNGLVIAARTLLDEGEVKSVLIIDLDAHCGGGTASLIADDSRIVQLDVAVNRYDSYHGVRNARMRSVIDASKYLPTVEMFLNECTRTFDLVLYNAGMDPHSDCDIGGLDGITTDILAQREHMVFQWCNTRGMPVSFGFAGGYVGAVMSKEALVDLHRLTIAEASAIR